ncbi:MAG: saccharopine dehydrogenase, partial [Xanthomonas perforans]|nr:saccharopine dehydrogenase [Xanthomonas perforans]
MTVRSPILCTDTGGEQAMTYRVAVLGGFGHFGARIVRALAATAQIHVI